MFQEFKTFALRGNVIDLAIGVIIGAAFGRIVSSLVDDIIMPLIGAMTGGLDFSNYYMQLTGAAAAGAPLAEARKAGAVLAWGNFLTVSVNFLIIAFVLFLLIRAINKLSEAEKKKEEPQKLTREEQLLTEIRDTLRARP